MNGNLLPEVRPKLNLSKGPKMKKCPACLDSLTEKIVSGVTVDVCLSGCGGIWFDMDEIKEFDEVTEANLEQLIGNDYTEANHKELVKVRRCPCCENQIMVRRSYDIFGEVEVDQCLKCSGLWLDRGELETIRMQFPTEEDRNKAGDEFISTKLLEIKKEIDQRIKLNEELSEQEKKNNQVAYKLLSSVFSLFSEKK